ncbi:MAG: hypothetical protein HY905_21915 [Deltaproteobacteria bacterium]|nr:hypothetical protein [Deltaproteobacteria bacterium]
MRRGIRIVAATAALAMLHCGDDSASTDVPLDETAGEVTDSGADADADFGVDVLDDTACDPLVCDEECRAAGYRRGECDGESCACSNVDPDAGVDGDGDVGGDVDGEADGEAAADGAGEDGTGEDAEADAEPEADTPVDEGPEADADAEAEAEAEADVGADDGAGVEDGGGTPTAVLTDEVWHAGGTPCDPASMAASAPAAGTIVVTLSNIPAADVTGTCSGHFAGVEQAGADLTVTIDRSGGGACFTSCWDFTVEITGVASGDFTVHFLAMTASVHVP